MTDDNANDETRPVVPPHALLGQPGGAALREQDAHGSGSVPVERSEDEADRGSSTPIPDDSPMTQATIGTDEPPAVADRQPEDGSAPADDRPDELTDATDAPSGEAAPVEEPPALAMSSSTYARDAFPSQADADDAHDSASVEPASPQGGQSATDGVTSVEDRDSVVGPAPVQARFSEASAGQAPPPLVEPEPEAPTRTINAAELGTGAVIAGAATRAASAEERTAPEQDVSPDAADSTDTGVSPIAEVPPRPAASAASAGVTTGLPAVPGSEMYDDADEDDRTPQKPRRKGNRALGFLLALLGTVVFAGAWAGAAYLILLFLGQTGEWLPFLSTVVFLAPIVIYFLATVLVKLLANRAGAWAHVLGSLLVGALVYFGMIGLYTFLDIGGRTEPIGSLERLLAFVPNVYFVVAGLLAREVALWSGIALAARGRRLKAQNAEARAEYERALQAHDDGFA